MSMICRPDWTYFNLFEFFQSESNLGYVHKDILNKFFFAAVVRATMDKVVHCSVRDEIKIGFEPVHELHPGLTMWSEILKSGKEVVIYHVAKDEVFSKHPVPAIYGFQSYIGAPVIRRDGTFFGALFAMDRQPRKVNNAPIIETFELLAELISCNLSL